MIRRCLQFSVLLFALSLTRFAVCANADFPTGLVPRHADGAHPSAFAESSGAAAISFHGLFRKVQKNNLILDCEG